MLPFKHRLNAKKFNTIYKDGIKYRGKYGMLIVKKDLNTLNPQFGYVVSKKIGKAPTRHRMTRLLRSITMDVIKEYRLEDKPYQCQYIAFEFIDSYTHLREEYESQILKAFEYDKENRTISN